MHFIKAPEVTPIHPPSGDHWLEQMHPIIVTSDSLAHHMLGILIEMQG